MKYFISASCLFLLVSIHTLAQSKFSIAPSYGFNFGNQAFTVRRDNIESIRFSENSHGSAFGLNAHYAISPQWDLSIGLLAVGLASNAKYYCSQLNQTFSQKQQTDYAQLPVLINYRLSPKRLAPYLSVGALFSNQHLTANEIGIKTSALVGIGIDYRLSPKLSLLVQPTVSSSLTRPKGDAANQFNSYHSYLVGLQTQLKWRF
jgi:hypothetical protein